MAESLGAPQMGSRHAGVWYRTWRVEFWLVCAGIVLLLIVRVVQQLLLHEPGATNFVSFLGAPLDDVYIHCRFAENLLRGHGFAFNPGEQLTADTSPLWVFLIALGGLFTSHLELVAIVLSALFYLMLGPGVYRAARDVFHVEERWAQIAGITTVIGSRMIWSAASGMEVTLAALLMLLAVEEHERAKAIGALRLREGVILGLGYNVRPEFLFLIVLIAADWIVMWTKTRRPAAHLATAGVVALLLLLPYPVFSYLTSGTFLSHSSLVQGAHLSLLPNFKYLWFALRIYGSNNVAEFALLAIGSIILIREKAWRVPIVLVVGLPILQAFIAPQFRHHGRYFFPVFPVATVIACAAGARLAEKYKWSRGVLFLSVALIVIGGSVEAARWIMIESESVRNINDQHLAIADWFAANSTSTDTLAVDDVGALAYLTDRPLIDLTGLMTPTLFPLQHDQDSVWLSARSMGANMFIIYDRLNPPFYQNHREMLNLVKQFRVREPLVSAADTTMSLYRLKQ